MVLMEIDEENKYSIESKRAKTDHNVTYIKMDIATEKTKERKRETILCNGNWERFNNTIDEELKKHKEVSYNELEQAIQKASKEIINKRYDMPKTPQIFGYNEEIKKEIQKRRQLCSIWKKETEPEQRKKREQEYQMQKEKVNELMDKAEAEGIKKILNKNGSEGINFWKTMKKIKKKPATSSKIRKENGEITDDLSEVLQVKRRYFEKLFSKEKQTEKEMLDENRIKVKMLEHFKMEGNMNEKITEEEVESSIKRSKDGAPGPDEITNMMLKNSVDVIKPHLTKIMNDIKENKEEFPASWEIGDVISFYKGAGDLFDMLFQRGITLTSCVLKTLESVVGCRIEPVIRENSTPLQGGGKKGESPEDYIFVFQTIIDKNKKFNLPTKLIITDVEKAFDQAWRLGVFENLMKRGIDGEILRLIWKMNNNIKARIKENSVTHSEIFDVEESLKQGGGLSAILYGQHISGVLEDLEDEELGPRIGSMRVPALAWQDDITLIPKDHKEESKMIEVFEKSTDKNRVKLAIEKKTKVLKIGADENFEPTVMKKRIVQETDQAKILGYIFNNSGNPDDHLSFKETETIGMMANMGLSINENHLGRIYLRSLLILYEKCFVSKILHGLAGIPMNKSQWEKLESIDRRVLRGFLNLPGCTPKVSLYNELGIIPLKYMLWRRKLGMWWRLNREESNKLMKQCVKEQIEHSLPWMMEINKIACKLQVDLNSARDMSKEGWKDYVKDKISAMTKEIFTTELEELKGYKRNVKDEVVIGKKKWYVSLCQRKAKVWFRMRADIIDPTPRQPYNPVSVWRCKFCNVNDQSTEHYVKDCEGIEKDIFQGMNRENIFEVIQTMNCGKAIPFDITKILLKLYETIRK